MGNPLQLLRDWMGKVQAQVQGAIPLPPHSLVGVMVLLSGYFELYFRAEVRKICTFLLFRLNYTYAHVHHHVLVFACVLVSIVFNLTLSRICRLVLLFLCLFFSTQGDRLVSEDERESVRRVLRDLNTRCTAHLPESDPTAQTLRAVFIALQSLKVPLFSLLPQQ